MKLKLKKVRKDLSPSEKLLLGIGHKKGQGKNGKFKSTKTLPSHVDSFFKFSSFSFTLHSGDGTGR